MPTVEHAGLGAAYLRSHPNVPISHGLGAPCGYCSPDPSEAAGTPRTKAGRDMLAKHGYRRPVSAEWIRAIEDEAAALGLPEPMLSSGLKDAIIAATMARGGTTTNCPLEGVHEHAFRGPHRFHEWEPAASEDRPPLPPRRCRYYHGVPGCRCQVNGIAGKPHLGPHHCEEHDYTWETDDE